ATNYYYLPLSTITYVSFDWSIVPGVILCNSVVSNALQMYFGTNSDTQNGPSVRLLFLYMSHVTRNVVRLLCQRSRRCVVHGGPTTVSPRFWLPDSFLLGLPTSGTPRRSSARSPPPVHQRGLSCSRRTDNRRDCTFRADHIRSSGGTEAATSRL